LKQGVFETSILDRNNEMTPQEAFWNSWFGLSVGGTAILTTLIVASFAIAYFRRRLRIRVAWNRPTNSGHRS
jgi:hypothetical protein